MQRNRFSPSEKKIVGLVCGGLTTPEIAERLHDAPRAVSAHLYRIFAKVEVSSGTELAARILTRGELPVNERSTKSDISTRSVQELRHPTYGSNKRQAEPPAKTRTNA